MPQRSKCPTPSLLLVAMACVSIAPQAWTAERACLPVVRDAWVRMPPVPMPMLAGFGRIDNGCATLAVIVGASSSAFGSVELHESTVVDGISRMRAVPRLRVAAHGERQLKPGGLHLMLMQPRAMPAIGDTFAVEFELSDGRRIRGGFQVRAANVR